MGSHIRSVPPEFALRALPPRLSETTLVRLPPAGELVALSRRARAEWEPLRDIAYAVPGTVIVGLDGTTLRIREDGSADEIGSTPRR